MSYIQSILQKHPDAGYWHQLYPWFSIGHLVHAANQKDSVHAIEEARKAALFFTDMPRLYWLLHQPEIAATPVITPPNTEERASLENNTAKESAQPEAGQPPKPAEENKVAFHFSEEMMLADNDEEDLPVDEEDEQSTLPVNQEPANSLLFHSLAQVAANLKAGPADSDDLLIETTHQHTIDYFASQGIKLENEPGPDDQLGRQLKSFTSWLRQMKPLAQTNTTESDLVVESFAAHSLQQEDVLTESMADVLLKQGKKKSAIEVMEKLRLLHPQKSHYFAGRIEQIKLL